MNNIVEYKDYNPPRQSYETYEDMKRQFLIDNPNADSKEIEIACLRFANELGI